MADQFFKMSCQYVSGSAICPSKAECYFHHCTTLNLLQLWDIRTFQCVMNLQENDDYISDFAGNLQKNTLLATRLVHHTATTTLSWTAVN